MKRSHYNNRRLALAMSMPSSLQAQNHPTEGYHNDPHGRCGNKNITRTLWMLRK